MAAKRKPRKKYMVILPVILSFVVLAAVIMKVFIPVIGCLASEVRNKAGICVPYISRGLQGG